MAPKTRHQDLSPVWAASVTKALGEIKKAQALGLDRLDKLDEGLDNLQDQLNDMEDVLHEIQMDLEGKAPVIPELEEAIQRNASLARAIDVQVPDRKKKAVKKVKSLK